MFKRMKVRRDGSIFTVFDDDDPIGNFGTQSAAFDAVIKQSGRVHLHWDRTVIAGEALQRDFTASFDGDTAGRIQYVDDGYSKGLWKAFPQGHNRTTGRESGGVQLVETKDEAVAFIERRYTELMAGVEPTKVGNAYAKAKGY